SRIATRSHDMIAKVESTKFAPTVEDIAGSSLRMSETESAPATKGKEEALRGPVIESPSPENLLQENRKEGNYDQNAVEGSALTEAQVPAVDPQGHNSFSADRCASDSDNIVALFDSEIGVPPDEWRITEANRRQHIVETFLNLIKPIEE